MPEDTETTTAPTQSRVHRFQVNDKVAYVTDGHDELTLNQEGVVTAFFNDEKTYLTVDFDGEEYTVTEDELRRLAG
jgi:hypothetical protein